MDSTPQDPTPCAFADDNTAHPLGRLVKVIGGEFHSSYRIRDREILVVNRQMKDVRFSITVLENRLNEEKRFLPVSYVVDTWDLQTDALKASQAFHQTWKRVGKLDLPETQVMVSAKTGGFEVRSITLSNHQLLSTSGQ